MEGTRGAVLGLRLLKAGALLFLLGLITGFVLPAMQNPRMGLASHLEGIQNGMFLLILGLVWPRLDLGVRTLDVGYYLALFGTFVNWLTTLLAGFWGAGGHMMPIAGGDFAGTPFQEGVVGFGLISLSVAMVAVCGLLLWGLRGPARSAV